MSQHARIKAIRPRLDLPKVQIGMTDPRRHYLDDQLVRLGPSELDFFHAPPARAQWAKGHDRLRGTVAWLRHLRAVRLRSGGGREGGEGGVLGHSDRKSYAVEDNNLAAKRKITFSMAI